MMIYPSRLCLRICISLLVLLSLIPLQAQEQLGMRLERYAGIYSTNLNPANTAFNPQRWDVSLVSADLYASNSFAFVRDASVPRLIRHSDQIFSIADTSRTNPIPDGALVLDYFSKGRPMYGLVQSRIGGPAISYRLDDYHTVGLYTAARVHVGAYGVPAIFEYARFDALQRHIPTEIDPVAVTAMAWTEIGLHYNYRNFDNDVLFSAGITPKLLLGYEGAFVNARAAFDFTQEDGDTVAFGGSARMDYGVTLGNLRSDNPDSIRARVNGKGGGFDLGVAWAMPASDGDTEEDYQWRIGVSLLDAGGIRFNRDAQKHRFVLDTAIRVSGADFGANNNAADYIPELSDAFLGNSAQSFQADHFSIALPTALSVQFDYRLAKYFYAGGVWVQRIPMGRQSLKRPNVLALVPRFEHRWFSASLPLVIDDWRYVRVGFAARLAFFTIGTDNLGSFLGQKRLTGTDFYLGLKINGFSFGGGNGHNGAGGRRSTNRSWRKIKCYEF